MRLCVTADLHFNHRRSHGQATAMADEISRAGDFDVLLLAGDTAVADGDSLDRALDAFAFDGPKLFLCGNHELWTRRPDSRQLFEEELPNRVRASGWHWLETEPYVAGDVAVVGTVGWYDYAFAERAMPERFYAAKVSPGAADRLARDDLSPRADDVPEAALDVVVQWNDRRFVKLGEDDRAFCGSCVRRMAEQLDAVGDARQVVVATHTVPHPALLPPAEDERARYVRAFLGSPALGEAALAAGNVSHLVCGHSHFPAGASLVNAAGNEVAGLNIGSGYVQKRRIVLDLSGQSTSL